MRQYFWLKSSTSERSLPPSAAGEASGAADGAMDGTAMAKTDFATLRRQHQLILDAIGEGVYGVDASGLVTFVNPAAAAMIGWQSEDLIGQSMHAILHHTHADGSPYLREACPIYAAFQDGVVHRVQEEVFWRKDGTSFPVEYISTPMRDEQGNLIGAVVAFRDITQRKWAEAILHQTNEALEQKVQERTAELQQLNGQLQALNELKSRLVSMVCHEFRNPLNNISLSVSYLDRYDVHLSPDQKRDRLTDIQANVERMATMIDDILVLGKVDANKIEPKPVPLDLVQFCQDLIGEIQELHPEVPIAFGCARKAIAAELDERLLRSILTNILANSIRYAGEQPHPIQFKLAQRDGSLVFRVTDHGIGIFPEDLPHLFEPFQRGRNASNIPGTGLGLSIVKQFVELLNGTITVQSQLGQGSTFTVQIPLTVPPVLKLVGPPSA